MNRREMLKLSCAGFVCRHLRRQCLELFKVGLPKRSTPLCRSGRFLNSLSRGQTRANPFTEVQLGARFCTWAESGGCGRILRRKWEPTRSDSCQIRRANGPIRTSSKAPDLDGKTGRFACVAALATAHGPVMVRNQHHFCVRRRYAVLSVRDDLLCVGAPERGAPAADA